MWPLLQCLIPSSCPAVDFWLPFGHLSQTRTHTRIHTRCQLPSIISGPCDLAHRYPATWYHPWPRHLRLNAHCWLQSERSCRRTFVKGIRDWPFFTISVSRDVPADNRPTLKNTCSTEALKDHVEQISFLSSLSSEQSANMLLVRRCQSFC